MHTPKIQQITSVRYHLGVHGTWTHRTSRHVLLSKASALKCEMCDGARSKQHAQPAAEPQPQRGGRGAATAKREPSAGREPSAERPAKRWGVSPAVSAAAPTPTPAPAPAATPAAEVHVALLQTEVPEFHWPAHAAEHQLSILPYVMKTAALIWVQPNRSSCEMMLQQVSCATGGSQEEGRSREARGGHGAACLA